MESTVYYDTGSIEGLKKEQEIFDIDKLVESLFKIAEVTEKKAFIPMISEEWKERIIKYTDDNPSRFNHLDKILKKKVRNLIGIDISMDYENAGMAGSLVMSIPYKKSTTTRFI